ncbi:MAG TPA: DUF2147 domain-containing protein [Methylovirgula sp.]|nr:DUF2147 domain-containing protein [Methylovirgula sp.]
MDTRTLIAAASLIFMSSSPFAGAASVAGPVGVWQVADGTANVAIRPCGQNLCGFVAWSKDGANLVGREVLIDMKPNGGLWSGVVVNAADGEKYDAHMSLVSSNVLKIEGCVMGGVFCGDQNWSRVGEEPRDQSRKLKVHRYQARND